MSKQLPEREKLERALLRAPSYRRADQDLEFLNREELRPVRLQLELLKPELIQRGEIVAASHRVASPS